MSLSAGHEGLQELLSDLLPDQTAMLLHLLACSKCTETVLHKILDDHGARVLIPGPDAWGDAPEEPPASWPAEADEHFAELLGHAPEERAGLLADERFQKASLVEALLETSRVRQLGNPELSEHLACLGGQLAGQVAEIRGGGRLAELLTRAAVLAANARRLAGNLQDADRAFANSLFYSAPAAEQALFSARSA
jgi:hypothetical protein